jgi:glycosyltransferase A (GT-A) superfamily protein (DUF2064 family)
MPADRLLILAELLQHGALDAAFASLARADAEAVYDACLRDVIALAARERGRVELWYDRRAREYFETRFPQLTCRPQVDGDFSVRLCEAFQRSFADGGERVVIIGHDVPTLSDAILTSAFHDLLEADVVAAPVPDGSCCLVGVRSTAWPAARELFRSLQWAAPQTMTDMIAGAAAANIDLRVLPGWYRIASTGDLVRARMDVAAESHLGRWLSSDSARRVLPE